VNDVLTDTLCQAVLDRLDQFDRLATAADQRSAAALAAYQIPALTATLRAILARHRPTDDDRCPHCSRWRRPHRFPCHAWTITHDHLIAENPQPAPRRRTRRRGRHR
jgi:hypothetical protein